jgi:hypothetical protein
LSNLSSERKILNPSTTINSFSARISNGFENSPRTEKKAQQNKNVVNMLAGKALNLQREL